MIDFSRIEDAFSKISQAINQTIDFEINGIVLKMRNLTDEEEADTMSEAYRTISDTGVNDGHQVFIHATKIGTLSRAIISINDTELRDKFIKTGEIKNGKEVMREKVSYLKEKLREWPKAFLSRAFAKYGELMSNMEIEAERAIIVNVVDFDSEIERLEERIKELKDERAKQLEKNEELKNKIMGTMSKLSEEEIEMDSSMAKEINEKKTVSLPSSLDEEKDPTEIFSLAESGKGGHEEAEETYSERPTVRVQRPDYKRAVGVEKPNKIGNVDVYSFENQEISQIHGVANQSPPKPTPENINPKFNPRNPKR